MSRRFFLIFILQEMKKQLETFVCLFVCNIVSLWRKMCTKINYLVRSIFVLFLQKYVLRKGDRIHKADTANVVLSDYYFNKNYFCLNVFYCVFYVQLSKFKAFLEQQMPLGSLLMANNSSYNLNRTYVSLILLTYLAT